ncbi:MAG: RidA family protein [Gemmatimonadetes bacterium]|nr:RidA family protein [Gemmatimonadota bacterium]MDA1103277.1 RidA family protein [Gemmatimonadota bacterium]
MNRTVLALFALAAMSACTLEERTDRAVPVVESTRRQIIQPEGVARLPIFSSAVRSGDFIFLSGALGALPGVSPPQLIAGGIGPETRQTMDNIIAVLAAADATLDDLIKCTVFLADIADYAAMNAVYAEYFPSNPPARSALAGSGLALGALVEIECIAAVPEG